MANLNVTGNLTIRGGGDIQTQIDNMKSLDLLWSGSQSSSGSIGTLNGSITDYTWLYLHAVNESNEHIDFFINTAMFITNSNNGYKTNLNGNHTNRERYFTIYYSDSTIYIYGVANMTLLYVYGLQKTNS